MIQPPFASQEKCSHLSSLEFDPLSSCCKNPWWRSNYRSSVSELVHSLDRNICPSIFAVTASSSKKRCWYEYLPKI